MAAMLAALALTAPAASACIVGTLYMYALREVPPTEVESGEVVLELDRSSMISGKGWVEFSVVRAVSGEYDGESVRVPNGLTSCDILGHDSDKFIVGRIRQSSDGPDFIAPRRQSGKDRMKPIFGGKG